MGAASAYESSVTQEDTYRNQAQLERYNSRIAEREAQYIDEQARAQDEIERKGIAETRGTINVSYAKSGVLLTTGSPLYMAGEFANRAEMSVREQRRQAALQANQQRANAIMNRYNASVADANANAVAKTRGLKVAGALMGDIADFGKLAGSALSAVTGIANAATTVGRSLGFDI